ncbi:MAG: hypothetical protein GXO14_06685 [Thermococci archaeon]|nr:hypothetical protein [Thermococci archaeon]
MVVALEFIVYGIAGKSMIVETEIGKEFRMDFEGSEVVGSIEVNEAEFEMAAERLKSRYEEFRVVDDVALRKFVFQGTVDGRRETLPAEPLEAFTKRFVENHVVVLKG